MGDRYAESTSKSIGPITLHAKHTGKPSAGNRPAGFDAAGAGTRLTVRLVRHSRRGTGEQRIGRTYGALRQFSTLLCPMGRLFARPLGRVEERRGAGPTGSRPFPLPAHQPGRADFPHPAFRLVSSQSTGRRAKVDMTEPENAQ